MLAFLALPLAGLLARAFSQVSIIDALRRPIATEALRLSLITTLIVLGLALALGSPLSLLLARRRFRGVSLLDTLVDLPMVLPPAVAGIGLLLTFGRRGMLGYARSIGLVEQQQEFTPWQTDAPTSNKPLRISEQPQLQRLIAGRFIPAQQAPQMDLFFDNPVAALINGIARALAATNAADAQRQLDRLYEIAPTHSDLAGFDRLLAALNRLGHPIDDVPAGIGFPPRHRAHRQATARFSVARTVDALVATARRCT